MRVTTTLIAAIVIAVSGCGLPGARTGQGEPSSAGDGQGAGHTEYALETDSKIDDDQTITLAVGTKVYTCAKAPGDDGRSKLQCSDGGEAGLSLMNRGR